MLERIQYQDYLKCLKKIKKANLQYLKEKSESYELNNNKHEKEIIKIDKKHDKMFRNILCNKKEITLFLNQFLKIILINTRCRGKHKIVQQGGQDCALQHKFVSRVQDCAARSI